MTVEYSIYLIIKRTRFVENGWPGYFDVILEPAYSDSGAARARLNELVGLYGSDEKRDTLAALGTEVRFYLRDISLVKEMMQ